MTTQTKTEREREEQKAAIWNQLTAEQRIRLRAGVRQFYQGTDYYPCGREE